MTLEYQLGRLEDYQRFAETYRHNGSFSLGNHQLVPIFEAVQNGLRRFLLAYGTGAGKTVIPIEIIKHLQGRGKKQKVLVVAPHQTILESFGKAGEQNVFEQHSAHLNTHIMRDKDDSAIPKDTELLVVNYEKFPSSKRYQREIMRFAQDCTLLMIDECHNIKNRNGKISRGLQEVIEATKDARLIALSASPCPNKMKDMGMVLYLLDPVRYQHYRKEPFRVEDDRQAIWEMKEKGMIRFFGREDVQRFYGLPELTEREPIVVTMPEMYEERYLKEFKEYFGLGPAVNNLERTSIEAMLYSREFGEEIKKRLQQGRTLNFFSHLRKAPRDAAEEKAIFSQLEDVIRGCWEELGRKRPLIIRSIHGDTPDRERLEIQREMQEGKVDALLNQWKCTREGFSEVTGHRPVSIIPLRCPFEPGVREQIIGRSYRPGQYAPVEYVEFHPSSEALLKSIADFVHTYADQKKYKVKTSWAPSLFHEDAYDICRGKEQRNRFFLEYRSGVVVTDDRIEVTSLHEYTRLFTKERILDLSKRDPAFGSGSRAVIRFVGTSYEEGLQGNAEPLGQDYDRSNILRETPGKINLFLADVIEQIKEHEGKSGQSWRIADLGCCSSAVFAQARMLWQALQQVRGKKGGLDEIVNVDGEAGFVRNAEHGLNKGQWRQVISHLQAPGYTPQQLREAQQLLAHLEKRNKLKFVRANFKEEPFGSAYDVVITSQCLQYNDQTEGRDIEQIVMNVNKALRQKGHYLTVLTGNAFNNNFTSENDVENFRGILEDYGFSIEKLAQIQGRYEKDIVLKPFHFIHATKRKNAPKKLRETDDIPAMYVHYVEALTGTSRVERLTQPRERGQARVKPLPAFFEDREGTKFKLFN